nr:1,4-dihydroxy-2-naphthoate octaprenyltransferase [Thalassolituus pacificus]
MPAALAPVLLSQSMAAAAGGFSWSLALVILSCALALQVAVNIANDLFDFQRGIDDGVRLGPARAAQSGWLSARELQGGLILSLLLAVVSGGWLVLQGGWPFALLGLASVLGVLAYSAGPLPLASHGLGEVTVFLFFGLLAVCGSYYLQRQSLPVEVWLAAVQMGLLTAAIMLVNNLRDRESDKLAGKTTLALWLGEQGSRVLYAALILLPLLLLPAGTLSFVWCALPAALWLVLRIWRRSGIKLNRQLAQTALFCLLFALLRALDFLAL